MKSIIKGLLLMFFMGSVLFSPIAHSLKYFVHEVPRYHHLFENDSIRQKVLPEETLFFENDRFFFSFLDRVWDAYGSSEKSRAYWIFPHLQGDPTLEQQTLTSFVCRMARTQDVPSVWLVSFRNLVELDIEKQKAVVRAGDWGVTHVQLEIDEVIYRAHDSIFVRARVQSVTEIEPVRYWDRSKPRIPMTPTNQTLYRIGMIPPTCAQYSGSGRGPRPEWHPT
tara:strand:+ start:2181 stop:2849 length:669 start_codon:yes stop_codon:yes gene_type:complete